MPKTQNKIRKMGNKMQRYLTKKFKEKELQTNILHKLENIHYLIGEITYNGRMREWNKHKDI